MLLVLLIGLLYSGLLYFRNPLNKLSRLISIFLFILRFVTVSFLVFLLLSPYVKTKKKQIEKPIVIIGHDNSSSILISNDSVFYATEFLDKIKDLKSHLEGIAVVDSYTFGENVMQTNSVTYADNSSNYSGFISSVKENYSGLNIGALVLIGDGIVNNGIDPVYAASDINFPIFTVALGDTSQLLDIKIDEVRSNSIVYSGDIFPVEVNISAKNIENADTWVRLIENNREISKQKVTISNNNFHGTVNFTVQASKSGKRRYRIIVDAVENEKVTKNNYSDIFVDILDSRLKVLVLTVAPHPDIGAIKQSLDHNPNFEVEVQYATSSIPSFKDYDVLVLYQIPSIRFNTRKLLTSVSSSGLPVLYIVGNQSRLSEFNRYFEGLKVNSSVGTTALAQFEVATNFSKFAFSKEYGSQLSVLPPLSVPLGNYQIVDGVDILAWQKISDVVTDYPLIAYYNKLDNRSAVVMGEGIWLWRIQSNMTFGNTSAIDALLSKTIMFLSAENDKRRFKVISEGVFDSRNDVIFTAELYNEALESDNSAEVALKLVNENSEEFNFSFIPFDSYYKLNMNKLPVGIYNFEASVKLGNTNLTDGGEFIVHEIDYESRQLNADHRMLSRLANMHDGENYYPNQIDELAVRIDNLDNLKSRIHFQDIFTGLNTIIWIMIALIVLLSVEWFTRKYFGGY